jgi:hypothetical protein
MVEDKTEWWICRTCARPYERSRWDGAPPQRCRCRSLADEETWPRSDFNERLHLCDRCHRVALRSGSRFSPFFCEPCKARVIAYNDGLQFWLIPIGRHSFMARSYEGSGKILAIPVRLVGAAREGDPAAEAELDSRVRQMSSLFDRMRELDEWSTRRLRRYLDDLGLVEDPTIAGFFRALKDGAEPGGRWSAVQAFLDLSEHMRASFAPWATSVWYRYRGR